MPCRQINYLLNVIYKIYCKDQNITDLYVGRTINFTIRKSQHKKCANDLVEHGFLYKCINENGGWNNWEMEIIEKYPCENSVEACKREQFWINTLQATLNVTIEFDKKNLYKRDWYFSQKIKIQKVREEASNKCHKTKDDKRQSDDYWVTIYYVNTNPDWYKNNKKYWKKIQKIQKSRNLKI